MLTGFFFHSPQSIQENGLIQATHNSRIVLFLARSGCKDENTGSVTHAFGMIFLTEFLQFDFYRHCNG
jgi:hypothetical protein